MFPLSRRCRNTLIRVSAAHDMTAWQGIWPSAGALQTEVWRAQAVRASAKNLQGDPDRSVRHSGSYSPGWGSLPVQWRMHRCAPSVEPCGLRHGAPVDGSQSEGLWRLCRISNGSIAICALLREYNEPDLALFRLAVPFVHGGPCVPARRRRRPSDRKSAGTRVACAVHAARF